MVFFFQKKKQKALVLLRKIIPIYFSAKKEAKSVSYASQKIIPIYFSAKRSHGGLGAGPQETFKSLIGSAVKPKALFCFAYPFLRRASRNIQLNSE
jgi:hypothetical protein